MLLEERRRLRQRIDKSNGRRIADTLTASSIIKDNPTPGHRKTLDAASEIKKAAGLDCLAAGESFSMIDCFCLGKTRKELVL